MPPHIGLLTYSRPPRLPEVYASKHRLFRIGPRTHAAYAALHGYSLLTPSACNASVESVAPPEWVKVFLARACIRHVPSLDYLLWIDADALVVNRSLTIEHQFALAASSHCSLMLPSDWKHEARGVNTGVLLMRNDAAAAHVLDSLIALYGVRAERFKRFPEQRGLSLLLGEGRLNFLLNESITDDNITTRRIVRNPTRRPETAVRVGAACIFRGARRRLFFSQIEPSLSYSTWRGGHAYIPREEHAYRTGDFIAHFTGGSPPYPPVSVGFVQAWMTRLGLRDAWKNDSHAR